MNGQNKWNNCTDNYGNNQFIAKRALNLSHVTKKCSWSCAFCGRVFLERWRHLSFAYAIEVSILPFFFALSSFLSFPFTQPTVDQITRSSWSRLCCVRLLRANYRRAKKPRPTTFCAIFSNRQQITRRISLNTRRAAPVIAWHAWDANAKHALLRHRTHNRELEFLNECSFFVCRHTTTTVSIAHWSRSRRDVLLGLSAKVLNS